MSNDGLCRCCAVTPPQDGHGRCWPCAFGANIDCRRCLRAGIVVSTPAGRSGHILRTHQFTFCGLPVGRARWTGHGLPLCARCVAAGGVTRPATLQGGAPPL